MRHLFFLPFLLVAGTHYGQIGLNVKYLIGQSESLDIMQLSQNGMQVSMEYAFRLKEKRLEFHPGLGYRFTFNSDTYDGYFNAIDLDLNTAIYPFDFAGDCDCPTFSKEGNLIKKGFFLEISPGVSYQTLHRLRLQESNPDGMDVPITDHNILWKIGGGAGIDIGITESFTITPMVTYTALGKADWNGLNENGTAGTLDDQAYLGAGLRMVYQPDDKRRRRRRY